MLESYRDVNTLVMFYTTIPNMIKTGITHNTDQRKDTYSQVNLVGLPPTHTHMHTQSWLESGHKHTECLLRAPWTAEGPQERLKYSIT